MVLIRSLTIALAALCVVPVTAIPTDLEFNTPSSLQSPLSLTVCDCGAKTLKAKPKDWVDALNNLTAQLTDVVGPTKELTGNNAFLVVANEGPFPVVLTKIIAFINSAEGYLTELSGEDPLKKGDDTNSVYEAYAATAKAALFWANVMGTKANAFQGSIYKPIGALGESALRGVLDPFENFQFEFSEYIPDRLTDVQTQAAALSTGFNVVINSYANIKLGRT